MTEETRVIHKAPGLDRPLKQLTSQCILRCEHCQFLMFGFFALRSY